MLYRILFTLLALLIVAGGFFFGGDGKQYMSAAPSPATNQPVPQTAPPADAGAPNPYAGLKAN